MLGPILTLRQNAVQPNIENVNVGPIRTLYSLLTGTSSRKVLTLF